MNAFAPPPARRSYRRSPVSLGLLLLSLAALLLMGGPPTAAAHPSHAAQRAQSAQPDQTARTVRSTAAAQLEEVTGFGSNPGYLRMFRYVPDGLPAGRPLVVALHGCTQSAAGFDDETGWTELAERYDVALLLPEQRSINNGNSCFNWFQPYDTSRGQGEALSIKQMVDRMRADHTTDPARTHVTGLSAGGAMTASMAASYPDVFASAAVVAGLPHDCARTAGEAFGCMNPGTNRSARDWGDRVRAAYPSYGGPWPTMSVWHGTADTTVHPMNMTELVEQWTNVHGTDTTPDAEDTGHGYPHKVYRDGSGRAVVESWSITGMPHGQPVDPGTGPAQCGSAGQYFPDQNICAAHHIGAFWGLADGAGPDDPDDPGDPAQCWTSDNYRHVQAGRAYQYMGYVYARGSHQYMGLYNVGTTHTLREDPPGYYVIADSGCST